MKRKKIHYLLVIALAGIVFFYYQTSYAACPAPSFTGGAGGSGTGPINLGSVPGGPMTGMETGGTSPGVNVSINEDTNPEEPEQEEIQLASIIVAPGSVNLTIGGSQSFTAMAVYSDNSTETVPGAQWSGGDGNTFIASEAGDFTITAKYQSISGSASITVAEPVPTAIEISPRDSTIKIKKTVDFKAAVTFDDGNTETNPEGISWNPGSSFRGTETGEHTITAEYKGLSDSVTVTVEEPVVTSLTISPAEKTIVPGDEVNFKATASFDVGEPKDVTGDATWSPSTSFIGMVAGTYTITAEYEGVSGSTTVTVEEPVVTSLTISPASRTIPPGETVDFKATASFDDGHTNDVTGEASWFPGTSFTGMEAGTYTITAKYNGFTGTASITVEESTSTTTTCPDSQEVFNGRCVPRCSRSESRDESGNCVFDPRRDVAAQGGPTCMSNADCPENHLCVNYKCMPSDIYDELDKQVRDRQGGGPERGPGSGAAGGGEPIPTGDYGKRPECREDSDCSDDQACENGKCVASDYPPYPPPHHRGDRHGEDVEDFVDDFIRDGGGHRGRGPVRRHPPRGPGRRPDRPPSGGGSGSQPTTPSHGDEDSYKCELKLDTVTDRWGKYYWVLFKYIYHKPEKRILYQVTFRIKPEVNPTAQTTQQFVQEFNSRYKDKGIASMSVVAQGSRAELVAKAKELCSESSSSQSTGEDCASLKSWWVKAKCDKWLGMNPNDPVFSTSSIGAAYAACKRAQPRKKQCEQNGKW